MYAHMMRRPDASRLTFTDGDTDAEEIVEILQPLPAQIEAG